MNAEPFTIEALLQETERLAAAGKREPARLLAAKALRLNDQSIPALTWLAKLARHPQEEIYFLKRLLQLEPQQVWASQRLRQLTAAVPATATDPLASPAPPVKQAAPARRQRKRQSGQTLAFVWLALLLIGGLCVSAAFIALLNPSRPAVPAIAVSTRARLPTTSTDDNCQTLIDAALRATEQECNRLNPNQVCYGNTTLKAQLTAGADGRFQERGDIISVETLLSLNASPLDPANQEWGIAVFKLLANLPRTLPGQNVTMLVFGNTTLNNASGDLQAFYFSSQLGQMACARVPFDGLLVHMPDGAGISFTANGTAITIMGIASLEAHPNDHMTVSIARGSASVTANGQTQYFGAGQEVQVPLGGPSGLDPSGPPSAPIDTSNAPTLSCTFLGVDCTPGDVARVNPTQAAQTIAQALSTSTPDATFTPGPTPTNTGAPTQTITPGPSPTPSNTGTPTQTITPGPSPTPSNIGTPTQTITPGPSPTPSNTGTPTQTITSGPSPTRTSTSPAAPSLTPTSTATQLPTVTPTATFTNVPTATATHTPTSTATPTATATAACQLTPGSLNINHTLLELPIQNNGGTTVTISAITVVWPETPASQKIKQVMFGGVQIDSSNYNSSPSSIPVGGTWTPGSPGDRQLPVSNSKTLEIHFKDSLQGNGYSVTVNFDNGCSVNASH